MPITTRTIAKGVPPRVHEPKGKAKAKQANVTQQSRKRVAIESESDEAENMTQLRAKKKQDITHHESQSEVELVEDNAEPSEEEVEKVDEQEVSTGYLFAKDAHQYLG
jgi:hypothetical protein